MPLGCPLPGTDPNIELGPGKPRSGRGFEGNFVAQRFELADVVAFLAFRVDAECRKSWTEIVEPHLGVGQ